MKIDRVSPQSIVGYFERSQGISQRTCMNDPWTWTMVWEFTVGLGGLLGGGEQRKTIWYNYNSINNKIFKLKN